MKKIYFKTFSNPWASLVSTPKLNLPSPNLIILYLNRLNIKMEAVGKKMFALFKFNSKLILNYSK